MNTHFFVMPLRAVLPVHVVLLTLCLIYWSPSQLFARSPQLLTQEELRYVGAFRLPPGQYGESTFAYGGGACVFYAKNNSLFLGGHAHHGAIAEASIPNCIRSDTASSLEVATVRQPFVKVFPKVPHVPLKAPSLADLVVVGDKLVGSAFEYYDATGEVRVSHFVMDSTSLAEANVSGLFTVGTWGGGYVGGFMAAVPEAWRNELGAPFLTGQAGIPIVSRTSSGPAAFGFDPATLGEKVAPAIPYVYYPQKFPLGQYDARNPLFNGTSRVSGIVLPPSRRTMLFFGTHGTGDYCYGSPKDCNDPVRDGKGSHSVGGKYEFRVWAFDVNDLIAVGRRRSLPWQPRPYAVWRLDFPTGAAKYELGGVGFDADSGRIYVCQRNAYDVNGTPLPLIHVYEVPTER